MPKRLIAPAYMLASVGVMAGIASYIKPKYKCQTADSLSTKYYKYFNHCVNELKDVDNDLIMYLNGATCDGISDMYNASVYRDIAEYTSIDAMCNRYATTHYLNDSDKTFKRCNADVFKSMRH
jgi:hypothetical protein